ncbi:DGQHR domain-containing protein [Halomonas sp. KM-1]|uniref:DGQHR domain-containing protein n=1 Tax=Halomonas sp. KM-1 TaxID=590061 RepID=UPI000A01F85C|nr:DGQHR domain-containing protein [Halomonas sp. KM-1]
MQDTYKTEYFETSFGEIPAFTFSMKVRDLLHIHYVAVRGKDDEEGAVQRILNKRRIKDIKNYVLDGNMFFNSFILNWTDDNFSPNRQEQNIEIPLVPAGAQVIDGQHRLAGLEEAMKEEDEIGDQEVIVTLSEHLTTPQAAKIFLNINTEQKPVPKSLIYDLFGEAIDDAEHVVIRATDIAKELNDDPESPLYKSIKLPGAPRGSGSIELSTFVSSFKQHLGRDGVFYTVNLPSFKHQKTVIENFFSVMKDFYQHEKIWTSKSKNPFLKAAGFNGAVDYLTGTLMLKCAERKSFTVETMKKIIDLPYDNLLAWDEMKGLDGKTARKKVKEYLDSSVINSLPSHDEYEF